MKQEMKTKFIVSTHDLIESCGIPYGVLNLPEGVSVDGDLIVFGEDELYLHCVISGSGGYYGVFKSNDDNHIYQQLLKLNTL